MYVLEKYFYSFLRHSFILFLGWGLVVSSCSSVQANEKEQLNKWLQDFIKEVQIIGFISEDAEPDDSFPFESPCFFEIKNGVFRPLYCEITQEFERFENFSVRDEDGAIALIGRAKSKHPGLYLIERQSGILKTIAGGQRIVFLDFPLFEEVLNQKPNVSWNPEGNGLLVQGLTSVSYYDLETTDMKSLSLKKYYRNRKGVRQPGKHAGFADRRLSSYLWYSLNNKNGPIVFSPQKVSRLTWDLELSEIFSLKPISKRKGIFGDEIKHKKGKWEDSFLAFGDGQYYYHNGFLLDKKGEFLLTIGQHLSAVTVQSDGDLFSASYKKEIVIGDISGNILARFRTPLYVWDLLFPNGSSRLVTLQKHNQRLFNNYFKMSSYNKYGYVDLVARNFDGLFMDHGKIVIYDHERPEDVIWGPVAVQILFTYEDKIFYCKENSLHVCNFKGESVKVTNLPAQFDQIKWHWVSNGKRLYSNASSTNYHSEPRDPVMISN